MGELRGGSDAATRAQVVQWMSMADSDILPAACTWVFPTMGIMQYNKNAFASAILFGENNNSSISGIWVWKGQELAFELCEDWAIDSGSYDWKKLDPKAEETKALVAQYWKWEGNDLEGRKFNQGKILK